MNYPRLAGLCSHTLVRLPARWTLGCFATLALVSASKLPAQTAAATSAANDEVIVLNPYVIEEEADGSFISNSVGSGSRLKLDLRDVPAAYSVINREFIDTLGITDLSEAATWAPGQTFIANNASPGANVGNQGQFTSRGFTQIPAGSNVTQSGSTGFQRNFYQSGANSADSFSVETFDFGRGPNSSLFGTSNSSGFGANGGAGFTGVASSQTKRARLDAPRTSIMVEVGYWGRHRATLDYNRPITPSLGMRLNLVDADQPTFFRRNYNKTRAAHLTMTWRPTTSTTLTVEGINEKTVNKAPGFSYSEAFSGWDGQTVFNGWFVNAFTSTTATPAATSGTAIINGRIVPIGVISGPYLVGVPGTTPGSTAITAGTAFGGIVFNGEPQGVNRLSTSNQYIYNMNDNTIMDWEFMATTRRAGATTRVPLYTRTAPNGVGFVQGSSPVSFGSFGDMYWHLMDRNGLPTDMHERATRNFTLMQMPGLRDNNTNENPTNVSRLKDVQFSLDQRITPNLFVSVGGDVNRSHNTTRNDDRLSEGDVQIDINMMLPDGSPNPGFLQPFVTTNGTRFGAQGGLHYQDQWTNDQAIRANITYTLNRGSWGNYTFNLNGNMSTRHFQGNSHSIVLAQPGVDPRAWLTTGTVQHISYLNDRERPFKELRDGETLPFTDVTFAGSVPTSTTSTVTPVSMLRGTQNEATTDYWTRYLLVQASGNWFQNRINFTGAVRRDYNKTVRIVGVGPNLNTDTHELPGPVPLQNAFPGIGLAAGDSSIPAVSLTPWDGQSEVFKPTWSGTALDYYNMTYQPIGSDGQPLRFTSGALAGQVVPRRPAVTRPTTPSQLGNNLQVWDPLYTSLSPFGHQSFRTDFSTPAAIRYQNTYTAGVTARPVRWFSPYVNFSNQGIPANEGQLDLNNEIRRTVLARGVDFGARFDFGNRLQFKANYFINERTNDATGNNVISRVNDLVNANNVNDAIDGSVNSLGIAAYNASDYSNSRNTGMEFEIAGTPVPGLRLTLNGATGSSGVDNASRFPITRTWFLEDETQDVMLALLQDAGGVLDTNFVPAYSNNTISVDYAPGFARIGVTPSATFALDVTTAVNAYNNAWVEYDMLTRTVNTTRNSRAASANFFADYTIQTGKVRNLRFGAGVQWQGKRTAYNRGSETILDPRDPTVAIDNPLVNSDDVVKLNGARNYRANVSYPWRLRNGNTVNLSLQIINPLNDRRLTYNYALQQPEKDLTKPNRVQMPNALQRIPEPLNFRLSATYSFGGGQSNR